MSGWKRMPRWTMVGKKEEEEKDAEQEKGEKDEDVEKDEKKEATFLLFHSLWGEN
jgi:hypothetical protein